MEVVCLILGPTLTSRPCSHTFWVLMSLHLLPFLLKMFLYIRFDTDKSGNISPNELQTALGSFGYRL